MTPSSPSISSDPRSSESITKLLSTANSALNEEFPPNIEVAFASFQKILEMDPNHIEALDGFGELLANLGDNERAIPVLVRSTELAPDVGASKYFYLGQMLTGQMALAAYRKCVHVAGTADGSRLIAVYCAIGELFMTDLCDEDEAETSCKAAFEEALKVDSESVEALTGMATFHRVKLEIDESKSFCQRAFNIIGNLLESNDFADLETVAPFAVRQRLAENMVELELVDEGLTVLSTLLEEDEEDIQSWFLTGCCHLVGKEKDEAMECLRQSRKLLKKNRQAMDPRAVQHWTKTLEGLATRIQNLAADVDMQ